MSLICIPYKYNEQNGISHLVRQIGGQMNKDGKQRKKE